MQSSEIQIGLVYLLLFVCFTAAVSALLKKSFTCQATIFLWIQTLLLHRLNIIFLPAHIGTLHVAACYTCPEVPVVIIVIQ